MKQTVTNGCAFRDRAIAEYHELLATDETFTPAMFEKLRSGMRKNRLLYGDRPIGIALRPHFLDQKQFCALTLSAERVTSALEKVAAAVVQDAELMEGTDTYYTNYHESFAKNDVNNQSLSANS